jgi:RNase P subunit RPR2
MENNSYDNKKLKELSADELQEIFRQRKEKLEQIEELARRRGINLTEIQHSTLSNSNTEQRKYNEHLTLPCPKCGRSPKFHYMRHTSGPFYI